MVAVSSSCGVLGKRPSNARLNCMMHHQTGNDFEELRNLARSQDASKQAQLALERANKEKQEAQRRAQQDAREKAEREKARQVLKLREEQKRRREEEEEKLALKRKEWQRQRQEQLERAAKEAKAGKAKVVTKKMIGQRERVGLGKGTSGKVSCVKGFSV